MKSLRFDVSGLTGFFKNPDLNSAGKDMAYSFPHIHKIAIAGIIGAILGWDGRQQDMLNPEFWNKFKDFKIAIIPSKPVFNIVKTYNTNTVGYANVISGSGATQEFSEHWLVGTSDNPLKWTIYIADNGTELFDEIASAVIERRFQYQIYLGNNTHFCDIDNAALVDIELTDSDRVHSIIPATVELEKREGRHKEIFYAFNLPIALKNGYYVYQQCVITNRIVKNEEIYTDGTRQILLF